jgi:S-adenosylmethionine:tRNA ribosyltransferase-isomerase
MTDLSRYDYSLPAHLIAQQPVAKRSDARLLGVDRRGGGFAHRHIRDLPELLSPGDALVVNNTRVVPARVLGYRIATGGRWEGLFLSSEANSDWRLLCKTRGKLRPPEAIRLVNHQMQDDVRLWLLERLDESVWLGHLDGGEAGLAVLERIGRIPLPPYIRSGEEMETDRANYQTVFATRPGAVAAPTAGLHFTPELLRRLTDVGISRVEITLHVGLDTFRPISVENFAEHRMHSEWGEITEETAVALRAARQSGGRIVAVGTTSVRVLETAIRGGELRAWRGETDLFIRPPYQFRAVDALMTNFHLPRTTLLLLVSAFAGEELIRAAYAEAIKEQYRFYSYGDAMLIT